MKRAARWAWLVALAAGGLLAATLLWGWPGATADDGAVTVKMRLAGEPVALQFQRDAEGAFFYELRDGSNVVRLTPAELAQRQFEGGRPRDWLATLLNVTSPAGLLWIALGLAGQVLFTGRMLVQWLASERAGHSLVPEAFWWMSLGGSTLLLAYFLWRVDLVGVLGQMTGWWVYLRNIILISRTRTRARARVI